jgi:hypothetical protein
VYLYATATRISSHTSPQLEKYDLSLISDTADRINCNAGRRFFIFIEKMRLK